MQSCQGFFYYNCKNSRQLIDEENTIRARTLFNSIVLARKWNANHDGVYVEKKKGDKSNPYLTDPDIRTTDGKVYTKRIQL